MVDPAFWAGRRVLVTGHSGFKGSWLTLWLGTLGAQVTGVSSGVPTDPSLHDLARVGERIDERWIDVRDAGAVAAAVADARPDVLIHMAAQPLVRRSFAEPRETYETNVMGTVNVLEAARLSSVPVVVNVTSDKCYDNPPDRDPRPFVEDDPMGGHDPYSNSKGCAELVADAYRRSFFTGDAPTRLGSARAGNVIGGGDWGEDRLIPDLMRGATAGTEVRIRNPAATRPWQHVLNPLSGYLTLAQALAESPGASGGWNFGPEQDDARPVSWIVERLAARWPGELRWTVDGGPHPHEAHFLSLDSAKARGQLGWEPAWELGRTLDSIVDWYRALRDGEDMRRVTEAQIAAFASAAA